MPRLHLVTDVIKSLWRIDKELTGQVNQCEQYRKWPRACNVCFLW